MVTKIDQEETFIRISEGLLFVQPMFRNEMLSSWQSYNAHLCIEIGIERALRNADPDNLAAESVIQNNM